MKKIINYRWEIGAATLLLSAICYLPAVFLAGLLSAVFTGCAALQNNPSAAKSETFPFYVYKDEGLMENHYCPSGWMGDVNDIKMIDDKTNPHSGETCLKFSYLAQGPEEWAGVNWQDPPENWGESKEGGYNLDGAKKLIFWARGEKGGETITGFKMGGVTSRNGDTCGVEIKPTPIILEKEWKQYTINLEGRNLKHVITGFCWVIGKAENENGCTFYLDEIRYE
ncbi:MAG: hypothetical protein JW983_06960 [Elusimicrobia bacterium]|nr:hypothetical protein [Elusimicrobiota bacterium]